LAFLEMLQPEEEGWSQEQAMVVIRSLGRDSSERRAVVNDLRQAFGCTADADEQPFATDLGLESRHLQNERTSDVDAVWWEAIADESLRERFRHQHQIDVLAFEGHRAHRWVSMCEGTYLLTNSLGRLVPVQVIVIPVAAGETVETTLADFLATCERAGLSAASSTRDQPTANPVPWKPVVALFALKPLRATPKGGAKRESAVETYRLVMDLRPPLALPPELDK
jgi:hypothetical protein